MIEIEVLAFCGAVEIIVPDGAEVELDGTPVLGSIEQKLRKGGAREVIPERVTEQRDEDLPAPSERPYFRIDCRAILGTIEVMGR